jgi:hypothetical protein
MLNYYTYAATLFYKQNACKSQALLKTLTNLVERGVVETSLVKEGSIGVYLWIVVYVIYAVNA